MDSCIVLRTAIVKDGEMHVQAGAGIVADSDPAYEQRECEAKAGALFAAARSEEHTSELQSLMRISDAVFCLKKNMEYVDVGQIEQQDRKINHMTSIH